MAKETGRSFGNCISPEAASSSSSLKNVLGYLQDYIPQSYASTAPTSGSNLHREIVHWARFETEEHINGFMSEESAQSSQPLVLLTGLSSGIVLWMITPNGDAKEVYSTLQDGEGPAKLATLLKSPPPGQDEFSSSRPLLAVVRKGSGMQKHLHSTAVVISLRGGGREVKKFEFEKNSILDISSNKRVVVIVLQKRLVLLDAGTFEKKWIIKTGYRGSELWTNPIALGERWLAFSDLKVHPHLLSVGGVSDRLTPPVASTVVNTVKKGFNALSDTLSGLTGRNSSQSTRTTPSSGENSPPVVTILDIEYSRSGEVQVSELRKTDGVLAHFLCHTISDTYITMLKFNRSGNILFSADSEGQYFNVFHISPNLLGSSDCKVAHLYSLYRGTTTGIVQDVSFSNDSRWCAVSTRNGTTHLFPISPYGGPVTVRTHKVSHVVNQYSRYHTSAGIEEAGTGGGGAFNNGGTSPLMIPSLQQIKQQYLPGSKGNSLASDDGTDYICVRAHFAPITTDNNINSLKLIDFTENKAEYSIYILGGDGSLTEYLLGPIENTNNNTGAGGGVVNESDEETQIGLQSAPKITWKLLSKPFDAPPTLSDDNHLISLHKLHQEKMQSLGGGSIFLPDKEGWLSQVELLSYAPPTRRLWMGPQFSFKRVSQPTTDEEEEGLASPLAVLPPSQDYLGSSGGGSLGSYVTFGENESLPASYSAESCNRRRRRGGRKEDETSESNCSSLEDTDVEAFGSWKDVAPKLKGGGADLELLIEEAMSDRLIITDDKQNSKHKQDCLLIAPETETALGGKKKSHKKIVQELY
ncbi:PREDICTED: breast carcinoma-amplified sequence 3 homolog isoform X6 [Amphimedon queenslandica]|uniref:BCAS3 WD40 domain-containing protein n=1 Tax=Amphimedon queenslandica TaxID=400682 RepID=A0AAN0IWI9_AMPQE|nr:PREDICTED: breast carcinoma-amplified sequence 3 homolog isoform X1 [Amphimedon queenslandica]XP_019848801.1 PREDICTED: breast carcinoma-amplified sequence 3 homolog isoform X6 [Amphimedon queenslandica]|eukprot:XP_019848796.1 PREDICTED: breast carcinoma-amplified sequence 3 homolog isoform X1 [Amphimedon queenslandica]